MKLANGSATHTGLVRGNNEDSYLVDDAHQLFAVADGIGGHRGGEVASRTAIEALRAAVASGRPVNDAISRANTAVLERAAGDPDLTGMGTTMTAVVVGGAQQLLVGHVGDSRAYLLHEGILTRLTDDHSLVEELVREGRLTAEQAESHPRRNIVTRALGTDPDLEVDLYNVDVMPGDRILICSDGLTTMVRERDIERLLRNEPDPQRAAEQLVDAANRAGGEDNTTIVVIDVLEVDAAIPPDPDALVEAAAAVPEYRPPMRPAPEPVVETRAPAASWGSRIRGTMLLFVPLILVLALSHIHN
jgi:serine/threonine protein phosphatase PrpC